MQGLFSGYFNPSLSDLAYVSVEVNSVEIGRHNLFANAEYKKKEIPFVFDGTTMTVKIVYSGAVTIYFDEIYAGLAPSGYIAEVDTTNTNLINAGEIELSTTGSTAPTKGATSLDRIF